MAGLRSIDTSGFVKIERPSSFGKPSRLDWIAIKHLVIDPEYQREISRRGEKNIIAIASAFDWSRFAPVIVAASGKDKFAIVDGQHRTTAAALCGIDKVPCAIIDGARAAQAAAFAAINTVVTAMSSLQVHAAKVAAGDERAKALVAACEKAGVTICRYPVPADKIKAGQTLAAAQLYQYLAKYGEHTLVLALASVARTRGGNAGLLRAPIIEALCRVIDVRPKWQAAPRLLAAMESVDFGASFDKASTDQRGSRSGVTSALADILARHLDEKQAPVTPASRPALASKPTPAQPVAPKPLAAPERVVTTNNGVTVEFTKGSEAVAHKGKRASISIRQAKLFELLSRGMPNPIGRTYLCQKLFGGTGREPTNDAALDLVASDAKRAATTVGLEVKAVKGIGFALGRAA